MTSPILHKPKASREVENNEDNSWIYFAVGKNVDMSMPNLSWVANNFPEKKICFLRVLQPSRSIPSAEGYATPNNEKKLAQGILMKYLLKYRDFGLEGDEVYIEMERVEEGIVKLISDIGIKNLVIGAAAREMVYVETKITRYIIENAAAYCQIWFLHKGNLIKTRYEQVLTDVCSGSTKETHEESLRLEDTATELAEAAEEACEESLRRWKPEKDVIEPTRQANVAEKMFTKEKHQWEDIKEIKKIKEQLVAVTNERNCALSEKSLLLIKKAELEKKAETFKEKLTSAVSLLQSFKNQRDDLQVERDRVLRANEELSLQAAGSRLTGYLPCLVFEVSYLDIEDATQRFHPSSKIGEHGNCKTYKGVLRGTEVAIKIFSANSSQGTSEYQQEVEVLSRLRHPNIVGLIGACPQAYAIVHEYLPNGSLEDRLSCKGNSLPLSWQARFRIAAELYSALLFLHSAKPHAIVHGDLKPSNILLGANFISKLSNFGNCHVISPDPITIARSAGSCRTLPKGTFAYLDPEFRTAVEPDPTPQLDVYSFGIILLKLLTGTEAWGIANEVQNAARKGKLNSLLDSSAGDWPYLQTRQLTYIALKCADESRKNRPCLESEVLKVLESISASCLGIPLSPRIGVDRLSQAPSYYICPITQDIMEDPHVAADGFTYELDGMQGWLRSGHNTSPMTNLKLAHTNLVPNRALRSAIQEWQNQS